MMQRLILLTGAVLLVAACGGPKKPPRGDGGGFEWPDGDVGDPPDLSMPCEGTLKCRQVSCGEGVTTTLSGKVYIPSGKLPLYNAIVYVPDAPLEPFKPGVTCDKCGAIASGKPIVTALTGADGSFVLENVPAGTNVPLVLQVGRWRRRVIIPEVIPCANNVLKDVDLQRLARNKKEGDIPAIAIATGSVDPFECLLRKVGIADDEFTVPTGKGRVHYFKENGRDIVGGAPPGSQLYGDLATLKKYDIVIFPCEGSERKKGDVNTGNLVKYADAGGRVFTTHYSYVWIAFAPDPWPRTGEWAPNMFGSVPSPFTATVDTSFPKGQAFSKWLVQVGASQQAGKIDLLETRRDLNKVFNPPSQRWVWGNVPNSPNPNATFHFTFNTPVNPVKPDMGEPLQCGRVVFSDFHVTTNATNPGQTIFPAVCKDGEMTAQEKALTFMLFDLSACVQKDDEIPEPPIP